jgi:hypothetical protein
MKPRDFEGEKSATDEKVTEIAESLANESAQK